MDNFENLNVWKRSIELIFIIDSMLKKFPKYEQFALSQQIRKAMYSVASNISEGSGKKSPKEKLRYLEIANGSLFELYNQMIISQKLKYINEIDLSNIKDMFKEIRNLSLGYQKYIRASI